MNANKYKHENNFRELTFKERQYENKYILKNVCGGGE